MPWTNAKWIRGSKDVINWALGSCFDSKLFTFLFEALRFPVTVSNSGRCKYLLKFRAQCHAKYTYNY
jgi:hypothetical protein